MSDLNKSRSQAHKARTKSLKKQKFMWQTLIFQFLFGARFFGVRQNELNSRDPCASKALQNFCDFVRLSCYLNRIFRNKKFHGMKANKNAEHEWRKILILLWLSNEILFFFQASRQRVISHRAIRITWAVIYHHNQALRLANRYSFKTFHDSKSVFAFSSASFVSCSPFTFFTSWFLRLFSSPNVM